eukprot:TRINITY_DN12491_c0_g2_i1.p1 TRINITY_DN12491_c0_g2~~TRINITY_DN12491_c0_g2_i1.p1  ORF type:complete len:490 (+),score=100.93 TRINITY_DN12491_c0_g2_i1:77-1546(+)
MTLGTPRVASARPPNRSTSSPALRRAASIYGSSRERGTARDARHQPGRPPLDPCVRNSAEPEFTGREERARQKCGKLRRDISQQRSEEEQLARRLDLLENSLQGRTQKLEELVDQLPQAKATGSSKSVDLKERLAQLNAWVNDRQDIHPNEQHGRSRERLTQVSRDGDTHKNDVQRGTSSASSDTNSADIRDGYHERSASEGPGRGHVSRKQEDITLAQYAHTQKQLHSKLQEISQQLEEERRAREAQHSLSDRLIDLLAAQQPAQPELLVSSSAGRLPPASQDVTVSVVAREGPSVKELAGPLPASMVCQAGPVAGPQALRQEIEALRQGERARRSASRRRCRAAAAAAAGASADVAALVSEDCEDPQQAVQGTTSLGNSECIAKLREELQRLQDHFQNVEQRSMEAEAGASEAQQAECAAVDRAKAAEKHAWATTEAANELALLADLRHVGVLEEQLRLKRLLTETETRCKFLESVANYMARQMEGA